MNVRRKPLRAIGTLLAYAWLIGGMIYYVTRFSRSFYIENEYQIRQAVNVLFGN